MNDVFALLLHTGRQKFLQTYKLRRRFSQGAIQPIREILDEMEERRKEEEEERERRERQTGKQKFIGAVKKMKNVRIFLAKDETGSEEENDDHLYEGKIIKISICQLNESQFLKENLLPNK